MTSRNAFTFLKAFLARPCKVASPIPSGRTLARRIAEQIIPQAGGVVLELGPGTGAVTRAILERGTAEEDLVLIESAPEFAALLRRAFPRARVMEGDAFGFAALLGSARGLSAIVSGLPVLGETEERKRRLLADAIEALAPGMPLIQFSYSAKPPLPLLHGVDIRRAATVWENIWPMRIWVYRRSGTKLRNVTE